MSTERAARTQRARRWLSVGAFGLLTGIGLSAVGQGPVGGWIAVAAAAAMVVGLHTFGRLGEDEPRLAPAKKKPAEKKKRRQRRKTEDGLRVRIRGGHKRAARLPSRFR
ncbi:MAG: hypothetical protein ACOC1F_14785 [Myxococcota bacterium]